MDVVIFDLFYLRKYVDVLERLAVVFAMAVAFVGLEEFVSFLGEVVEYGVDVEDD